MKPLGGTDLKRLHRSWRKRTTQRLAVILDGVQQPYNVGGLIRSSAAYGVSTVWTVPPTADPSNPKVQVTAKGCDRFVEIVRCTSRTEAITAARNSGFHVVAIELAEPAVPLFDVDLARPAIALVLGHEDRGVHRDTLNAADTIAYLPLAGQIGSLNVAHAGTAALAEVRRQHWTGSGQTSSSR